MGGIINIEGFFFFYCKRLICGEPPSYVVNSSVKNIRNLYLCLAAVIYKLYIYV